MVFLQAWGCISMGYTLGVSLACFTECQSIMAFCADLLMRHCQTESKWFLSFCKLFADNAVILIFLGAL